MGWERHQRFENCLSGMDRFLFIYCQEHWSSFRYCGALFVCWSNGWQRSGTHRHHGVCRWFACCHHFGISSQDPHDCTISSCQGSRDWPRWFERGTLAFPWSKYLSKARLICFVHAGGSNVLGWSFCWVWCEEGKHNISGFASHSGTGRKPTIVSRRTCTFSQSSRSFVMVLPNSSRLVDFGQHAWNWSGTTVWDPWKMFACCTQVPYDWHGCRIAFSIRRACFARCERFGSVHRCWVCTHEEYWTSFCFRYLFHLSTVFDEVFQQAPVSCDAFLLWGWACCITVRCSGRNRLAQDFGFCAWSFVSMGWHCPSGRSGDLVWRSRVWWRRLYESFILVSTGCQDRQFVRENASRSIWFATKEPTHWD